jgi:hypothetical protein
VVEKLYAFEETGIDNTAKITAFTASLHQRNQPADGFRGLPDDGRPSSRMMAVAHLPHDQ